MQIKEKNAEGVLHFSILTVPWETVHYSEQLRGSNRGRGREGNYRETPLLWLPWEGKVEARQAGLGLAILNNFSEFWGIGAVPGCLISGFGEIRANIM